MKIKEEEQSELIVNLYSMIAKLSDRVYDLEQSKPITINLNKDQDFNDIRFSIATMAAMDCNANKMEKFYLMQ